MTGREVLDQRGEAGNGSAIKTIGKPGEGGTRNTLSRRLHLLFTGEERLERIEALENLRIAIEFEKRQFEGRLQLVPVVNYSPDDTIETLRSIQAANSRLGEGGLPNSIYFCEGDKSKKPVMAVMGRRVDLNGENALLVSFSNVLLGAGVGISFKMLEIPRMHLDITEAGVRETYPAIHEETYRAACSAIRLFTRLKPQAGIDRSRLIEFGHPEMRNITPSKS